LVASEAGFVAESEEFAAFADEVEPGIQSKCSTAGLAASWTGSKVLR
jgi:translation elongation factor EF-Ts